MLKKIPNLVLFLILIFFLTFKSSLSQESYFDLSDEKIEIQTNFIGQEIIIFGLTEPNFDTIITIKGPKQNTEIRKKERLFGFWFNTKKIIFKDLPSIFFIASSKDVKKILLDTTIARKNLFFDEMINNLITQRNFNYSNGNKFENWRENLIEIKKDLNLYKEYKLKIIDDKLFQTKVFFPSSTVPGNYDVNIYQIDNKIIVSEKNKKIIIKKVGIGSKIFKFAHDQPVTYGILAVIFSVLSGLLGATIFRKL